MGSRVALCMIVRDEAEMLPDFLAGVVHIQSDPVALPHVVAGKASCWRSLAENDARFSQRSPPQGNISGHGFPGVVWHICPTQDAAIDRRGHELRNE